MANIYYAVVSGKRKLSEDTWSIQYNCPEIAENSKPGNFIMVRPNLPDEGIDPITPRPFGIYAIIEAAGKPLGFSLIVKVMGKGTKAIVNKNIGDKVQINAPLVIALISKKIRNISWRLAEQVLPRLLLPRRK